MAKVHLYGVGNVDSVKGSDIKVGMILLWNYGFKSEVVGIKSETKAFTTFLLKSCQDGQVRERRMSKKTYWGVEL